MSARHTRRWFTAIPITGRFYIMFAILLLSLAGIVFGALRAIHAQSDASADLARVAVVHRALDRALDLQASITSQMQAPGTGSAAGSQNLAKGLRAQLESLWTLPATMEVAAITDSLRQPAAQYLQGIDNYLRDSAGGNNASAWVFADLEPRRAALENGLRDAETRLQAVLQRVESRVVAEADGARFANTWLIGGGLLVAVIAALMLWAIARSIQQSIHDVGEVAQALAAGDMDNRCEPHGTDEVSALARMINLLADTMQGMLTRLRSEANRSSFSNQLVEALEMADSEAEADRVIARAMGNISDVHPMELLLADSSRAHLERACVHPKTGSPNCSVDSPYSCIAVRRGYPQIFPDAEALNACPKLLGRMGGAMSAACVPVNFMGRALGVLHVAGAKGKPPNPEQIAQLTALGVHAGNRIGTLRAFERSQLQASTDSLTGLTNRRVGEEVLANLMSVDTVFSVVMADLDFFKRLNDTMGHDAGDRALKLFADTARGVVRDRDHVIRWGGEEFALLLPAITAERAAEVVDRLRAALAQAHLTSNTPIFTASFGIADSSMARDRETIIRLADEALYRSKQAGRDRCSIADPQQVANLGPRRERDQGAVVDITQVARG
ncbi:MAG TPA: diguanylate cyclase [Steroidobacteraceae bacterium]|jgi:diguanylate cyclase (GGDEF)-like protein|nr:diguanylate cyclase [Steroidobacteraceae bacterium]